MNTPATVAPLRPQRTLYVRDGSKLKEAPPHEIIAQAEALVAARYRAGEAVLDLPNRTASFLRLRVGSRDRQIFGILHLDAEDRLIEVEDLFSGTLDSVWVEPREILTSVLAHRSVSVVLYQNYPSGGSEIPQWDILRIYRVQSLLATIDVPVRDFLGIGKEVYSLVQRGLL